MSSKENNGTPKMPPWAAEAKLPVQVPPAGAFDLYNINWTGPIRDNGWLVNVAAIPCARLGDFEEGERKRGDTSFPVQRKKRGASVLLNNRYPCKYGKLQGDKRKQRAAQGLAVGTKCTKSATGDSCKKGCPYSFSAKQYALRSDVIVLKYTLGKCACKTSSPCECFDSISDAQMHHKNEHGEFIHQDCKDHFPVSDMARAKIVELLHSKVSTAIVQDGMAKLHAHTCLGQMGVNNFRQRMAELLDQGCNALLQMQDRPALQDVHLKSMERALQEALAHCQQSVHAYSPGAPANFAVVGDTNSRRMVPWSQRRRSSKTCKGQHTAASDKENLPSNFKSILPEKKSFLFSKALNNGFQAGVDSIQQHLNESSKAGKRYDRMDPSASPGDKKKAKHYQQSFTTSTQRVGSLEEEETHLLSDWNQCIPPPDGMYDKCP